MRLATRATKIIGARGGCDNMKGVGLQMKFMRYGIGGAGCELSNSFDVLSFFGSSRYESSDILAIQTRRSLAAGTEDHGQTVC